MKNEATDDPIYHVENMIKRFHENVKHLREDIKIIKEPQCKAIFETAAEVLLGLIKTLEDYKSKKEEAWQK